jgi:hypothetical protein
MRTVFCCASAGCPNASAAQATTPAISFFIVIMVAPEKPKPGYERKSAAHYLPDRPAGATEITRAELWLVARTHCVTCSSLCFVKIIGIFTG